MVTGSKVTVPPDRTRMDGGLDGQYSFPPRRKATDGRIAKMMKFRHGIQRRSIGQESAKVCKVVWQNHTTAAF